MERKQTLVVRNVDARVVKALKLQATREGITLGHAVNRAILLWTAQERKPRTSFLKLKPVRYPALRSIDEDAYGV